MIQFTCMYCQTQLSAPDDKAGQPTKCSKCGRTMRVPTAAKAGSPLRSPVQVRIAEPVDDGEIPLADEQSSTTRTESARPSPSFQTPRGRVILPAAGEDSDRSEIPLADELPEKKAPAPPEHPPTVTPAGLVVTTTGDVTGISFQHPKILDAIEIEKVGQELCALVDEGGCRKFFLDFGNVKFLSSQMLGVLMMLQKRVTAKKGRLVMCALSPELQKLFQIVKLDRLLPIVPDRLTAQGMLSQP